MKKILFLCSAAALIILSCSRSGNDVNEPASNTEVSKINHQQDFAINNLKLSATTVKEWLSNENVEKILFTFFSKDLTSIGSNMTLSAYVYEKNSTALSAPVFLEISSKSSLQLQPDITLPNNQITISKIKRIVSDESGIIDFDYLLFEPKYYTIQSNRYISFSITPYKNGEPISNAASLVSGGDGDTKPSPPADPGG